MDCKHCGVYMKGEMDVCESCQGWLRKIATLTAAAGDT